MNQDYKLFTSQHILEILASTDPSFIYNMAYDLANNVTGIVWVTSYMRNSFDRFEISLSIDVIHSKVCNAKEFYYIPPVVLKEIRKINVVIERFMISETHEACTLI